MSEKDIDLDFRQIVDAANDIVVITTAPDAGDPEIVYVNHAFTRLTGYSLDEVVGRNPRFLQENDRDQEGRRKLRQAIHRNRKTRTRIRNYSKSGQSYWLDISLIPLLDSNGEITHFVAIERDVSAEVRREERLREMAKTDELTELLNRRAFDAELEREFGRRQRYGSRFSLMLFDIDHFKEINDGYGHAAGDSVLEGLGNLCRNHFRDQDVVARIGGEEFAVILPETGITGAMQVAERFRRTVEENAFMVDAMSLQVTISIGVSAVGDEEDADSLFVKTDEAMYRAKKGGRNRVCCANDKKGEGVA